MQAFLSYSWPGKSGLYSFYIRNAVFTDLSRQESPGRSVWENASRNERGMKLNNLTGSASSAVYDLLFWDIFNLVQTILTRHLEFICEAESVKATRPH